MRILRIITAIIVLIVLFTSCKLAPPDYFGYRDGAMRVTLTGKMGARDFEAEAEVLTEGNGVRVFRICYRSPSTLKGLFCEARLDRSCAFIEGEIGLTEMTPYAFIEGEIGLTEMTPYAFIEGEIGLTEMTPCDFIEGSRGKEKLSEPCTEAAARALLAPILCFFEEMEILSAERREEGYRILTLNGAELFLSEAEGGLFPTSYKNGAFFVRVKECLP